MNLKIDPYPSNVELNVLWQAAWSEQSSRDFGPVLSRSLAHIGAYSDDNLIGFVNVAWDGARHAFILDTCVHPGFRRQGIATALLKAAETTARERGAHWLHVDFEPHLAELYRNCGFKPTRAGICRLV